MYLLLFLAFTLYHYILVLFLFSQTRPNLVVTKMCLLDLRNIKHHLIDMSISINNRTVRVPCVFISKGARLRSHHLLNFQICK